MKMSKRSKLRGILRFPETSVTRWRESLRGGSWSEVLEAIVVPQNSASQLKAVKKAGDLLELRQEEGNDFIGVVVEIHSICPSRHPLQRAITSVLLSLPDEDKRMVVVQSVSANILRLLSDQLPGSSSQKLLSADCTVICTTMQYMESLLENFTLGEMGLKLQLPLAVGYCTRAIFTCSSLEENSCSSFGVLIDTLKITMNVLHRFSLGFFPAVIDANSWTDRALLMTSSGRLRWIKCELMDLTTFCTGLLLRDSLPRDITVAAAMLLVVVHNIASPFFDPLFGYMELVVHWLSRDNLKPFTQLALCHAFLAKIPTNLMASVQVDGKALILILFPVICRLFDEFTETSDRYVASRTLTLWSSAAKDYVVTSKETGSVSHALLPPSGEIILELLRYIWSLWEDPVDGIRHQCKEMFENIINIHQQFDSAKNEHLLALAKLLLSLESPTRGKFILLSSLSQHLAVGELVSTFPHLPGDLLSVMGHQSLACHAGELWSRLVQVHWKEVHESEEAEAIWNETWVLAVLKVMRVSDPLARRHTVQHCLPSLFRSNDHCMEYINHQLPTIATSPGYRVATQLACLKCAKTECKSFAESEDSCAAIFRSAMHHSDQEICLSALCLLCESLKTTDAPPPSHLDLLLEFVEINGNNQSPGFRYPVLTAFKKMLNRMRDSSYALLKLHLKGCGPDPISLINSYRKFLQELLDQQFQVLHPFSSFQRRYFSLSILQLLSSCFKSPSPEEEGPTPTVPLLFEFPPAVSKSQASTLWEGLRDSFDANRLLCLELLLELPVDKVGLTEPLFVAEQTAGYLALVSKPKSVNCSSAAYILKFLLASSCSSFNLHLATLLNEESLQRARRRSEDPPSLVTLDLLCCLLHEHIAAAKVHLVSASMSAPMYGILQSIRAICEQKLVDVDISQSYQSLSDSFGKLIDTCKVLSELVSPVVCSSSPEGFLPEASGEGDVAKLVEGGSSSSGSAQSLLLCCWHTMKEVSLLLGHLVEQWSGAGESQNKRSLLTNNQMDIIADIFIHQLTEARHRGAFEMAYAGFSRLCSVLWTSPSLTLSKKPQEWVTDLLESLQSSSIAKLLTVTRRSAGLPFFMQAILTAEPSFSGRACLKSTMEVLLKVARDAITKPQLACSGDSSPMVAMEPAAVHALNILRALYRDSRLRDHVMPFIPEGVVVAIAGFTASLWPIRNSSNLLFTSLILRIFGAKKVQDEDSMENKMTAREFFTRFPSLYDYLLDQMQQSTQKLLADWKVGSLQPSLLPLLLLLSRLYPSPLDETNSPTSLKPFIALLLSCTCCSVWKTRVLVARALSLMLTEENCADVMREVYERMTLLDQNTLHGLLLVVKRTIQERKKLITRSPDRQQKSGSILVLIFKFHAQKLWIGQNENVCTITRSLYLEILNNLLELDSSVPYLLHVNSDVLSSLLSALAIQSLRVCSNNKTSAGKILDEEGILLQSIRLVTNYLTLSHCDVSISPAEVSKVMMDLLGQPISLSAAVSTCALECVSVLEKKQGISCSDDVLRAFVDLVVRETDEDLLAEVYNYLSEDNRASKIEQLVMVLSRAYDLFEQNCIRLELRMALIRFLSTTLLLMKDKTSSYQYLKGLLKSFQQLILPTESFEIRLTIASDVLKLWPLSLEAGGVEISQCCKLVVQLLQDVDSEVRKEMANVVTKLLLEMECDTLENLNSSSALKFFILQLPCLILDANTCFDVLLSLLPENSNTEKDLNSLFDEDPLNNYAEDLVLLKHIVVSLEAVIGTLCKNQTICQKHYDRLTRHISTKSHDCHKGSVWEKPCDYLYQAKAKLLYPLVVDTDEKVKNIVQNIPSRS